MNKTNCKIGLISKNIDIYFNEFVALIGEKEFEDHWNGFFGVKFLKDGNLIKTKKMAYPSQEKLLKYETLATEKANRLDRNLSSGHLTSYESRNPNANVLLQNKTMEVWGHWGGSVLINKNLIFSFSGLPELLDEAFVCFIGIKSGLMSKPQFAKIKTRRMNNPHLDSIHKALIKK